MWSWYCNQRSVYFAMHMLIDFGFNLYLVGRAIQDSVFIMIHLLIRISGFSIINNFPEKTPIQSF